MRPIKAATKSSVQDLAVFGGRPLFAEPLHVGRPNIGDREGFLRRVNEILDSRRLTNDGPYAHEFEERIKDLTGARYCVALCNGTLGLELAIRAAELSGEVIVPSFTFAATAQALEWHGIRPVFCDIDAATHNLDPAAVEALITPRTTAIIGVHVWGRPCDEPALASIASRRGLKLLFDAAHAFGCSYGDKMVGVGGNAEVFSFHATKYCHSFEGGAAVTNDGDLAEKIRLIANHGFSDYDLVVRSGTNAKMNEISAAMGLSCLDQRETFVDANRENYHRYAARLADQPGVALVKYCDEQRPNYQYIVAEVDPRLAGLERDALLEVLWAENILARRYFFPGCHRMEPFRGRQTGADSTSRHAALPHTEEASRRTLCLPTGEVVSLAEIDAVCELIRFTLAHGRDIRSRLSSRDSRRAQHRPR